MGHLTFGLAKSEAERLIPSTQSALVYSEDLDLVFNPGVIRTVSSSKHFLALSGSMRPLTQSDQPVHKLIQSFEAPGYIGTRYYPIQSLAKYAMAMHTPQSGYVYPSLYSAALAVSSGTSQF